MPNVSSLSHLPRGPCRSGCISGDTCLLSFQGMGLLTTSHPSWWHSRAVGERGARTQRGFTEGTESKDSEKSDGDESESIRSSELASSTQGECRTCPVSGPGTPSCLWFGEAEPFGVPVGCLMMPRQPSFSPGCRGGWCSGWDCSSVV